eukprot:1160585-Pelagomonas_calceolata.AAC.3
MAVLSKVQGVQGTSPASQPSQAIEQHSISCKQHMDFKVMELDLVGEHLSHGKMCRATQQPLTDTFTPSSLKASIRQLRHI